MTQQTQTRQEATQPTSHTLEVPGAVLTYDVRAGTGTGADASSPVLMLIGSPMGAAGFATLAGHFPDRTVVTYDPRGVERSRKTDGVVESTPEQHADDLHAVIEAAGGGRPVDLFASSGGAVNALALVARHPNDVRLLVAHEPPLAQLVPDREAALAACEAIQATYQRSGFGPALAQFIALVGYRGELPADWAAKPPPDPATFGLPTDDDGSRDDALVGGNIITCTHYVPDFEAMRAAPTRIVVAVGEESEGELAHRGGEAVAARLEIVPVTFPSHHGGFLGAEHGQAGKPDEFAATLREVLESAAT
jgi:pimeloyl-ACP methyl ester carboxylesterase